MLIEKIPFSSVEEARILLMCKFDISHLSDLFDQRVVIFAFERRVSKLPIRQIVFNRAMWLSCRWSLMSTSSLFGGRVSFIQGHFAVVLGLNFVLLIIDVHKVI